MCDQRIQIIDTTEDFGRIGKQWGELTSEPLQSFEWNFSWWENFGSNDQLRIYCYFDADRLVGIAPFFVDRWLGQSRLRFLGSGDTCTDYTQVIVLPEFRDVFFKEIVADLQSRSSVAMVELEGVRVETQTRALESDLEAASFWRYDRELEPTWNMELPDTWDEFVAGSKKSLKRKIKKARKRLTSGEITIQTTENDLDFESAFETLVKLHQERFVSKGKPGVFSNSSFYQFLKQATSELVKSGRAEIILALHEGKPIGSHLYLNSERGPQLYQSGFCASSMHLEPGHLLFTFSVNKAIENGCPLFDFLRGSEPYKPFWGAEPQPLAKIRCVSNQIVPSVVNRAYRALRQCKQVCQQWIPGRKQAAH